MRHDSRRRTLLTFLALGGLAAASPTWAQDGGARGDPQAEQFVQSAAQRVVSVLADRKLTVAQKSDTFH